MLSIVLKGAWLHVNYMAITFDSSAKNVASSATWSHTCTGSNLILIVGLAIGQNTNATVTYNGVSMTMVGSAGISTSYTLQYFYLLNPSTGTNTISCSNLGSSGGLGISLSYAGVLQSGFPDSSSFSGGSGTGTPLTNTTTVLASNCWLVNFGVDWTTNNDITTISTNKTDRQTDTGYTNSSGKLIGSDSNGTVSTGSQSVTLTSSGTGTHHVTDLLISITPALPVNGNMLLCM